MLRALVVLSSIAVLGAYASAVQADESPPSPTRWVTDNAGFISDATRSRLDDELAQYNRTTGHQIIVWIGDTTGDVPLEDWTIQAFTKWKVGRKGLDDGLALFIFARDHKLRIEVGYGLEDKIPDVIASRIIRQTIVPLIKSGDHDQAVSAGVDQIIATLGGHPPAAEHPPASVGSPWILLLPLLWFGLILLLAASRARRYAGWAAYGIASGGGFWGGGSSGFGGGGGGFSDGGGGFSGGGGGGGGGGASGGW